MYLHVYLNSQLSFSDFKSPELNFIWYSLCIWIHLLLFFVCKYRLFALKVLAIFYNYKHKKKKMLSKMKITKCLISNYNREMCPLPEASWPWLSRPIPTVKKSGWPPWSWSQRTMSLREPDDCYRRPEPVLLQPG